MAVAINLLRESWAQSGQRLEQRCLGLTDEELLWMPARDTWTIVPDSARPGRWTYDYDFAPPPPAPVTSIGWRLFLLVADNEIYWEYAFGPGERTFRDLEVPHTAAEVLAAWRQSREPMTRWLGSVADADLSQQRRSHLGGSKSAGEVLRILLDEQTHHGAEIALLRDLYLRRTEVSPREPGR